MVCEFLEWLSLSVPISSQTSIKPLRREAPLFFQW